MTGAVTKDQLAALSTPRLIGFATERLDAPDPQGVKVASAWDAVSELQRRADRETLNRCARLCLSGMPDERRVGATVLAQLGVTRTDPRGAFSAERYECLAALLQREIAGEAKPQVLADVCIALSHLHDPRTVAQVLPLRSHPSPKVRYGVASALADHDDEQAIATLIELSNDGDAEVRDWATFGLGSLIDADTPAIRDALLARLSDPDAGTRAEAIMGLARRQDRRVTPVLIEAFTSGRFDGAVLEAAAVLADPGLCPALMAARAHGLERQLKGHVVSADREWNEAVAACKCPLEA